MTDEKDEEYPEYELKITNLKGEDGAADTTIHVMWASSNEGSKGEREFYISITPDALDWETFLRLPVSMSKALIAFMQHAIDSIKTNP